MAGPSTTGTLGLDISEFDSAWHEAMADIAQLEPELKQATAALKLMERNFRGAGSGAAVSAKQVDNQRKIVKTLTSELKSAKSEAKAFRDLNDKPAKPDGLLSSIAKVASAGAILNFAHTLLTSGRNANELTKQLDSLDLATYADNFTKADAAARGFRGTMRDIAGSISSIPIVGQVFDIVTSPIKAAADALQSYRSVRKEVNAAAEGSDALLTKLKTLEEEREKVRKEQSDAGSFVGRAKVAIGGMFTGDASAIRDQQQQEAARAISINRIESERATIVDKLAEAFDLEARARNSSISDSEKASELAGIELNRREKIAALTERVKNTVGLTSKEGKKSLESGTSSVNSEAAAQAASAERRYDITLDTLKVSDKISVNALRSSLGQLDTAKELFELAERTYNRSGGAGEEQRFAEKAKMDAAKAVLRQAEIAYGEEITALRLQTQATEAHFKGMQGVAQQAEIVARFDKDIATQLRAGNKEASDMLKRQKEIALATERAREHDVTPRERLEARRDSRIVQRKAKQQEARENELRKRGARGIKGIAITEQQLKDRNINEGKLRIAQAEADEKMIRQGLVKLFGNVDAIDKSLKQ